MSWGSHRKRLPNDFAMNTILAKRRDRGKTADISSSALRKNRLPTGTPVCVVRSRQRSPTAFRLTWVTPSVCVPTTKGILPVGAQRPCGWRPDLN